MSTKQVDYSYKIPEFGTYTVDAIDNDEAAQFTREYLYDTYPDISDISIDVVRSI